MLDKLDHGVEGYYNMWQKVRSIWRYTHEHFAEDFDYFTMSGDDDYYVMENLRQFLLSPAIAARQAAGEAVYLGRRLLYTGKGDLVFNTGGAGYVLTRRAGVRLARAGDECARVSRGKESGWHKYLTRTHRKNEDVHMAWCLRNIAGGPRDAPLVLTPLLGQDFQHRFLAPERRSTRRDLRNVVIGPRLSE